MTQKLNLTFSDETKQKVIDFLFQLVKISSVSHEEQEACEFAYQEFSKIPGLKVTREYIDNSIKENPLWHPAVLENPDYTGHFNVKAVWEGTGEQEPVYLDAHIDTVSACDDNVLNFRIEDGVLHGLGCSDNKGGIASIYAIMLQLSQNNVKLPFDVIGHIVVEEEIGCLGALAITNKPDMKGQAAIMLEPTNGTLHPVARGVLWLKLHCHGKPVHAARAAMGMGIDAYDLMVKAVALVRSVHNDYCDLCAKNPVKYYENFRPPMVVGVAHSGTWPAAMSGYATATMSIAVLPNWTIEQMQQAIADAFAKDPYLNDNVELEYIYRRGSRVLDFDHPTVLTLQKCAQEHGMSGDITAMRALDDGYFYQTVHNIPSITFGPGDGNFSHTRNEQIVLQKVFDVADVLLDFFFEIANK